ncbi:MAG: DUF2283 domain-containing protein [Nitrospira sp.]|nr:DUF2283 domain-containing protein [Nitrospira sp.]
MKLSYDAKYNIAYLRLHEKIGHVTTIKVSEEMNIDIAPDGTVYGIELLNAKEQLADDHGTLIVESEGQRREIPLTA